MREEDLVEDSNHAADSLSSFLVVTSDDNNTDTGRLAFLNSSLDLNPRRIQNTSHTHEN